MYKYSILFPLLICLNCLTKAAKIITLLDMFLNANRGNILNIVCRGTQKDVKGNRICILYSYF
jgi:hypothetical protein